MSGIIVSTDRLIASSEARKRFAKLLKEVSSKEGNYYVILENGKVTALLVHPNFLKDTMDFPDLEKLREDWNRHTESISDALDNLMKVSEKDLPALLQ